MFLFPPKGFHGLYLYTRVVYIITAVYNACAGQTSRSPATRDPPATLCLPFLPCRRRPRLYLYTYVYIAHTYHSRRRRHGLPGTGHSRWVGAAHLFYKHINTYTVYVHLLIINVFQEKFLRRDPRAAAFVFIVIIIIFVRPTLRPVPTGLGASAYRTVHRTTAAAAAATALGGIYDGRISVTRSSSTPSSGCSPGSHVVASPVCRQ